jgi:phosphoribosylaminoimidazole-succinocarboxamide synthase
MLEVPELPLEHLHRGKVRDLYAVGDGRVLMVASDRLSAFDVVMGEPVPDKGRVLTAMSVFWFGELSDVVGNHLVSTELADLPASARRPELEGRFMLCRRVEMVPVECIVRGYLAGSAWKEYRELGTVHSMAVPPGMVEAERLDDAMFTPSTKAAVGDHDENISFDAVVASVGGELAEQLREVSLSMFRRASRLAEDRGYLLADTKFELGFAEVDGRRQLVVADEVLTPDSSRFWRAAEWAPGATPVGFDKQPVRDHLDAVGWDRTPPPPALPEEVVRATSERYRRAYEDLTGLLLSDWPGS